MPVVAVMTDSNCGLLQEDEERYGISIIPMPVVIDGNTYYEGVDISQEQFYEKLSRGAAVTSSQPSPGDVMDRWDRLLKDYDEIVYIPMSSGLSHSYACAAAFAGEYDGRVHVVDNHRISITQAQAAFDARILAEQGKSGAQIKGILEREALDASIYIAVDTLEYLQKGGRVTPAGAAIGTVLNIKPVLTIQGGKLDAYAKTRGMKSAFKTMCRALKSEISGRFHDLYEDGCLCAGIADTHMEREDLENWKEELARAFPELEVMHIPLTLSIGCHIGPGGLGVGVYRKHRSDR